MKQSNPDSKTAMKHLLKSMGKIGFVGVTQHISGLTVQSQGC